MVASTIERGTRKIEREIIIVDRDRVEEYVCVAHQGSAVSETKDFL